MFSMLSILLFSHLLKPVFCGLKTIFIYLRPCPAVSKVSTKYLMQTSLDVWLQILRWFLSGHFLWACWYRKCRKYYNFTVCTVIRPPKDHTDFFESLDISQETSNTLKKFKELLKISDCWACRHYEKKNYGVAWKLLTCFVCVGLSMSEAAALTSQVDALRGKKSPGTEPLKVPLPLTLTIAEWLSRCV